MSFVPQVVSRNWRLKLAALGLSIFLWAVVRAEPSRGNSQTVANVPVLVQVSDLDWTTAGSPQPSVVDVRIASPFGRFPTVGPGLAVRVPIARVVGEDTVVELRRDWVVTDGRSSVQVQDINPPQVRITFEETRSASIPLFLRIEGELPDEVALAQPLSVNPGVVRVRGRASRVDAVDSLPLEPLDLGGLDESGTVPLEIDTTGLSELSFSTTEATVEIRVEEALEQSLGMLPVRLEALPPGADTTEIVVEPAEVELAVYGGRTRVAQIDPAAVRLVIPGDALQGMQPGEERTVPLAVRELPELVEARLASDSVTVRWEDDGEEQPEAGDPEASDDEDGTGDAGGGGDDRGAGAGSGAEGAGRG